MKSIIILLISLIVVSHSTVYFSESFSDGDGWKNRWVLSKHKGADAGKYGITSGEYFGQDNEEEEKGLKTLDDYRFYQVSSEFKEDFSNRDKTLVVQFSVKHEQKIDCGGGYIKILPKSLDQANFNGESTYNIMFGPDICGTTRRVHVIFNYKGQNHLLKREIQAPTDDETHVYTLVVKPDQTYKVLIDEEEKQTGKLVEDWDFLPPETIPDPKISKPADWVDEKEIVDPSASKPEGWDDIPEFIRDPDATKPDDWDESLDGDWEAPLIPNPDYKGEWVAPKIPNPAYKGEWKHPHIPNPDYKLDNEIYAYNSNKFVGIEIWQVKAGTIFDNFLVTDSEETAHEWAKKSLTARKNEQAAKAFKKEKEEEERQRLEAESAGKEEEVEEAQTGHEGHAHHKDEL